MIDKVFQNLLCKGIVYITSLYLNLCLLIIFLIVFWLCLKSQFYEDPNILFDLFLYEAAPVHENCLDC